MLEFEKAVDVVYYSYMKAQSFQEWDSPDSEKRNPSFSKEIIAKYITTKTTNILVTGSKGKGSVATILATLLENSCTVGLTTSPHVTEFNDRFRVNGNVMSKQEFIDISDSIKGEVYDIDSKLDKGEYLSPIGVQAVIALKYFGQNNTDINIFECGKGVKYDDINNITHSIAILNTVFLEHTRELGSTIIEILQDKLAIVTQDTTCLYVGNVSTELVDYITAYVSKNYPTCKVKFYGDDFYSTDIVTTKAGTECTIVTEHNTYTKVNLPLFGSHQAENLSLALAVYLDLVQDTLTEVKLNEILASVSVVGRLQILQKEPLLIVDTCINRESCKGVLSVLEQISPDSKLNFIVCIPDDKDYLGVVQLIAPKAQKIVLTKTKNAYYKFTSIQQETLTKLGIPTLYKDNLTQALSIVNDNDCCILCTTGLLPEIM